MNQQVEVLVNALYNEWKKTHDCFDDNFELLLAELLPNYSFGYSGDQWYIIQIL